MNLVTLITLILVFLAVVFVVYIWLTSTPEAPQRYHGHETDQWLGKKTPSNEAYKKWQEAARKMFEEEKP